jgi:phage gp45-like
MFGETSHAPPGAHGLLLSVAGRRDQAVLLGLEHETHRPRNLAVGDRAIYDAHGNIISLVQQNIRIVSPGHVHVTANGGNVEITGSAKVNVRAPQINLN